MPTITETRFTCRNPDCQYTIWTSYEEDSSFLPDDKCPICGGQVVDSDETRQVTRPLKTFIDASKKRR
jgi:transcription initiation factor IIE alpha subunit